LPTASGPTYNPDVRPRILIVDDEPKYLRILELLLQDQDYELTLTSDGANALTALARRALDVVLTDLQMPEVDGLAVLSRAREVDPDLPVIVVTAFGTISSAVEAMRLGAFDYVQKPFDDAALKLQVARAVDTRRLRLENRTLRSALGAVRGFDQILGSSPALAAALDLARRAASTDTTVLLCGESGTGKELFAHAIHAASPRAAAPFVKVNCAAIPAPLLEAELFGVEKGAYTGAEHTRAGTFERADGGTLFLDEIGELELGLQPKLLRALEERVIARVGGGTPRQIDVRFVAATNRDLEAAANEGRFRTDLYHRLAVFPIALPPLREGLTDFPLLVGAFIRRCNEAMGRQVEDVSAEAMTWLRAQPWPGNVRQLANCVERAMILCDGARLELRHFASAAHAPAQGVEAAFALPPGGVSLDEVERALLQQALARSGGNKVQAAKLLGLTRNTLRYRLEKYELE
jgi:DNA-binding NtrC family response regulator